MNCVGIGKILCDGPFGEVFVPPAPGDSGTAIGAALAAHQVISGVMSGGPVRDSYIGPAYPAFSPAALPPGLFARQISNPAQYLAAQLTAGRIAGLFQGRLEVGPRALGNRSILASPLTPKVAARKMDPDGGLAVRKLHRPVRISRGAGIV
jgi:carbamoyltransferase